MSKNVTISVYGAGSEIGHIAVSKKAYLFWKEQDEDMLVQYLDSNEEDIEYDVPIPKEADFLTTTSGKEPWFEADTLLDQKWQVTFESGEINIEVDGKTIFDEDEDGSTTPYAVDVIVGDEEDEDEVDICYIDVVDMEMHQKFIDAKYFITFEGVGKGIYISYEFEIDDEFDKTKLVFATEEDQRTGRDYIKSATYNGNDLENEGGDSDGKGNYAYVWKHGE